MAREDDDTKPQRLPTTQTLNRAHMARQWVEEAARVFRDVGFTEEADAADRLARAVRGRLE